MMVLVATGLLSVLSTMTEDRVVAGQALATAAGPPDQRALPTEDRASRSAAERRQQRVSTSSGYQIETGASLPMPPGAGDSVEGSGTGGAAAALPAPIAMPAERSAPTQATPPAMVAWHDAGKGAEVTGLDPPMSATTSAERPQTRVKVSRRKHMRSHTHTNSRPKRLVARRVATGEPAWVRSLQGGG